MSAVESGSYPSPLSQKIDTVLGGSCMDKDTVRSVKKRFGPKLGACIIGYSAAITHDTFDQAEARLVQALHELGRDEKNQGLVLKASLEASRLLSTT